MLPSEIPRLPTDPPVRMFPGIWKLCLFKDSLPISISTSFVSLFIFYILSYLLLKTMGCLSGCLMSSVSIQKLFCGICSAFKCSFNEFVGEKVVSPSYSSTISGPLPSVSTLIASQEYNCCIIGNVHFQNIYYQNIFMNKATTFHIPWAIFVNSLFHIPTGNDWWGFDNNVFHFMHYIIQGSSFIFIP